MHDIEEITGDQIPEYWKKVLEANRDAEGIAHIGVGRYYGATTLFHRQTKEHLTAWIETVESSLVRLYPDSARPQETKPDFGSCHAEYTCGPVNLTLEGKLEPIPYS